jgi:hypothetical protein
VEADQAREHRAAAARGHRSARARRPDVNVRRADLAAVLALLPALQRRPCRRSATPSGWL